MSSKLQKIIFALVAVSGVAAGSYYLWRDGQDKLPAHIASGNGRIEAVEIDIAPRTSGRVADILVDEGRLVTAGQVLARMDTAVLNAQMREARAELQKAEIGIETALSQVTQREAEMQAATAVVAQREAELDASRKRLARSEELAPRDAIPQSKLDEDRAGFQAAKAAVAAAEAQTAAARAAIGRAESDVVAARATAEAVRATIQRIEADVDDSVLKSPRDGRVQYRVAQPGEILAAGSAVLNMVDLNDVYMTFFLPTGAVGRLAVGGEARIVLDAAPQYVIPATVSFVADVAQFTPKTVETAEERQKLLFRVKVRIDPDLLNRHLDKVKTGLPGAAYVRLDPDRDWPANLAIKVPQ